MAKIGEEINSLIRQLMSLSIAIFFCSSMVLASTWIKSYRGLNRDFAFSIAYKGHGGCVVAGKTDSFGAGDFDFWVLKTAENGSVIWEKAYGGMDYEAAYSIEGTADGGYIVAGLTKSFGAGVIDIWILKLKSDGSIEWQNAYGGIYPDDISSIQQTDDGGYIAAGKTRSFGEGEYDGWILKLYPDGTIQWQKTFGGPYKDEILSIQQTRDRGFIAAGYISSSNNLVGSADLWVLKLDNNGSVEWQNAYGGSRDECAFSIQQTDDGGFIAAGKTASFDPKSSGIWQGTCGFLDYACFDSWVLKLDANGLIEWQKRYFHDSHDEASSIQQTDDGGYIVAGTILPHGTEHHGILFFKLNRDGELEWQREFHIDDDFFGGYIKQTSDGGYILAGYNSTQVTNGAIWVLKINSEGYVMDCHFIEEIRLNTENTDVIGTRTTASISNTSITPYQITVSPSVTDTNAMVETKCLHSTYPAVTVYDATFCEVHPNHLICTIKELLEKASLSCIGCSFSDHEHPDGARNPEYIENIYKELMLLFMPEDVIKKNRVSIKRLETLFAKAPTGFNYNKKIKASLMKKFRDSKEIDPRLLEILIEALNALELDFGIPTIPTIKVKAGKYSAVDFGGVAWVAFRNQKKSGEASLNIASGMPAPLHGFRPGWPNASYHFKFTGELAENGYADISFYIGGINFIGHLSDLCVFQWDGKSYKDITTNVDLKKKVITGRTDKLSTYVIVTAEH